MSCSRRIGREPFDVRLDRSTVLLHLFDELSLSLRRSRTGWRRERSFATFQLLDRALDLPLDLSMLVRHGWTLPQTPVRGYGAPGWTQTSAPALEGEWRRVEVLCRQQLTRSRGNSRSSRAGCDSKSRRPGRAKAVLGTCLPIPNRGTTPQRRTHLESLRAGTYPFARSRTRRRFLPACR